MSDTKDRYHITTAKVNSPDKNTALKGKFYYSLPGYLKFPVSEFSVKIGKLSTFISSISTISCFFVDIFFISLLAGITSFAILTLDDWRAVRVTPIYIFPVC